MNMIKKTQYKFIAITLSAILLVLMIILGILNLGVYAGIIYGAKQDIEQIRDRKGFIFNDDTINSILNGDSAFNMPNIIQIIRIMTL